MMTFLDTEGLELDQSFRLTRRYCWIGITIRARQAKEGGSVVRTDDNHETLKVRAAG